MDPTQLVDVRAGSQDRWLKLGSGYRVTRDLVLTSTHVVVDDAGEHLERIELRIGHPAGDGWLRCNGSLVWQRGDIAIVRLEADTTRRPTTSRWGQFTGRGRVRYTAVGYPQFARENEVRGVEQLSGDINPLSTGGRHGHLVLDQDTAPDARRADRSWRGVSGAAVFCGDLLCGVVVEDDDEFGNRRLYAAATASVFGEDGFRTLMETAGEALVLESVEFQEILTIPTPERSPPTPAALLTPANSTLAFVGRDALLQELQAPLTGAPRFHVSLISGAGGQGKTRLALELLHRCARRRWVAGFVPGIATLDIDAVVSRTRDTVRPVVLIIDYAEASAGLVEQMVARLANTKHPVPIHLVLLARAAGEWWNTVAEFAPVAVHVALPPLAKSEGQRNALFDRVVDALAKDLACSSTMMDAASSADWRRFAARVKRDRPVLAAPDYENVLVLQTQALTDLLDAGLQLEATEDDPLRRLAAHERRILSGIAERRGLLGLNGISDRLDPDERRTDALRRLDRALVGAALIGPSSGDAAMRVATLASQGRAGEVLGWLGAAYPDSDGRDGAFGAPTPDRVAEELIASIVIAQPEVLEEAAVLIDDKQVYPFLFALIRTCIDRDLPALRDAVADLISGRSELFGVPALRLASDLRAPAVLLEGLTRWARRDFHGFVRTGLGLSFGMSDYRHARSGLALMELLFSISATTHSAGGTEGEITHRLIQYALCERLVGASRFEEALEVSTELIDYWRAAVEHDPDSDYAALIGSLDFCAIALEGLGYFDKAVELGADAVRAERAWREHSPDVMSESLARTLDNQATRLLRAGRWDESVTLGREAFALWSDLIKTDRAGYLKDYVTSANMLFARYSTADDHESARALIEDVLLAARELSAVSPHESAPVLAAVLSNYAANLSATGAHAQALDIASEAVELSRMTAEQDPEGELAMLARALGNLSVAQAATGDLDGAIRSSFEAVGIFHILPDSHRGLYRVEYGQTLALLARTLLEAGRVVECMAPLILCILTVEHLPEGIRGAIPTAFGVLRSAYASDPAIVETQWQEICHCEIMPDILEWLRDESDEHQD